MAWELVLPAVAVALLVVGVSIYFEAFLFRCRRRNGVRMIRVSAALAALFLSARSGAEPGRDLRALDECIAFLEEVVSVFHLRARTLANFAMGRGPRTLAANLRSVFERHLGSRTLGDLHAEGKKLLVLAVDKQTWRRRTFRSFDFESDADRTRTLVDVALACTAFPVALPAHRSEADGREYLDGALVTNNPSLVAVREALAHLQAGQEGHEGLDALTLLSLGGTESSAGRDSEPRQGLLSWLPPTLDRFGFAGWSQLLTRFAYLPDFLIQGSVDIIDLQCADLLGPRYRRVRPSIPELDYFLSLALPPGYLKGRLDEAALRCSNSISEELAWLDTHWLPSA